MFPGFQQFPEGQIIGFALVFLRLIAFVIAWPVFGVQTVPVQVKVLLAIVLSVILFPTIGFQKINLIQINDQIVFLSVRELFIGLTLGFFMRMFFFAVSIGAEMIGVSSGIASAQLYNPTMGTNSNVFDQFHIMLATLFFLAMNGHHMFLSGLAKSFEMVPIADIAVQTKAFSSIALAVKDVFFMGLKIGAPVLIAILITNITMGIIGRAVPQMNVLMTSLQVTILITCGVIILTIPLFVEELNVLMNDMAAQFFAVLKVI